LKYFNVGREGPRAAGSIYAKYKAPFCRRSRRNIQAIVVRDEDVQVLHWLPGTSEAQAYLKSNLSSNEDVVNGL